MSLPDGDICPSGKSKFCKGIVFCGIIRVITYKIDCEASDIKPFSVCDAIREGRERVIERKHDGSDEAISICARLRRRAEMNVERPACSSVPDLDSPLYGIPRNVIWGIARVLARISAAILQLHVCIMEHDGTSGAFKDASQNNIYSLVPEPRVLDFLDDYFCYVEDEESGTVYYCDSASILKVWEADGGILENSNDLRGSGATNAQLSLFVTSHLTRFLFDLVWVTTSEEWQDIKGKSKNWDKPNARELVNERYSLPSDVVVEAGDRMVASAVSCAGGAINRPKEIEVDMDAYRMEKLLLRKRPEARIPIVPFNRIAKGRTFLIDSGASNDTYPLQDAKKDLRDFIRKTSSVLEYSTAAENIVASQGMRVQIAPWDVRSDVVLMNDAPNLLSLGARCLHGGMSFIWLFRRMPAFIPACMKYIVVLDVDGVLPTYPQLMGETSRMVGTFSFGLNRFNKVCGIEISRHGKVELDLARLTSVAHSDSSDILSRRAARATVIDAVGSDPEGDSD